MASEAYAAGEQAAKIDHENGKRSYDPARCLLAADKWAREQMLAQDAKPSEARAWMQDWIIGYAAWYEDDSAAGGGDDA